MTEARGRMARVTLPRARVEPNGVEQPIPDAKTPLPRWQTIPLDAKFPVVPAPKGEVTFVTTKLGECPYKSKQNKDFDLSDPYNRTIRNEYNALFDPYLKGWLAKPQTQKLMKKNKLMTDRGNIPCSVRDFNEYRLFLRKQAVMVNGPRAVLQRDTGTSQVDLAKARKNAILAKTKLKAEVFGVEVKYRSLKAQQAMKELEEEKRKKYMKRAVSAEARQSKRIEEEEQRYMKAVNQGLNAYASKIKRIKEREAAMQTRAQAKLHKFEMEAQDKLNKLDYLREQRFQLLDQARKRKWRERRLQQQKELEAVQKQRHRVEAQNRSIKRQIENQMARAAAKNEVALDLAKESRFKKRERDNETYARRMAQILKNTRYMTFSSVHPNQAYSRVQSRSSSAPGSKMAVAGGLTRQASVWMVQEVLNRLGLSEESWRLKRQGGAATYTYLGDLDTALTVAVRRIEGLTVLGEEQEMLSRLVHLTWRGLKTVYPGKVLPDKVASTQDREEGGEAAEGEEGTEEKAEEKEGEEKATPQTPRTPRTPKTPQTPRTPRTPGDSAPGTGQPSAANLLNVTEDDDLITGEELNWFIPDGDDDEEIEQAVKISMLVTGEIERNTPLVTRLGDPRPVLHRAQRIAEEKMDEYFKTRMRMTETDALAVEAELLRFLETLKEKDMRPEERQRILSMCIQLANHDVIIPSDPCGDLEMNPDGHSFLAFEPGDAKLSQDSSLAKMNQTPRASITNQDPESMMSKIGEPITEGDDDVESSAINRTPTPELSVAEPEPENAENAENETENANTGNVNNGNANHENANHENANNENDESKNANRNGSRNRNRNNLKAANIGDSGATSTSNSSNNLGGNVEEDSEKSDEEEDDEISSKGDEVNGNRDEDDANERIPCVASDSYSEVRESCDDDLTTTSSQSDPSLSTEEKEPSKTGGRAESLMSVVISYLDAHPNVNENKAVDYRADGGLYDISQNMADEDPEEGEEPDPGEAGPEEDGEEAEAEDAGNEEADDSKQEAAVAESRSGRLSFSESVQMAQAKLSEFGQHRSQTVAKQDSADHLDPEEREELIFKRAVSSDNIVGAAEQILIKFQTREKAK
ncbi:hypothetical protein EGW08_018125, partial [Elysia chlorotica]